MSNVIKTGDLISEVDLKSISGNIKPGDKLVITQGGTNYVVTVNSIYANQIFVNWKDNNYIVIIDSKDDDKIEMHMMRDGKNPSKSTLKNIESVRVVRNGNVVDKVMVGGEEPNDDDDVDREERRDGEEEVEMRRADELKQELAGADVNDIIEITTGFINTQTGEMVEGKDTVLQFNIEEIVNDGLYRVSLLDVKGEEADSYKTFKRYDNLYIGENSLQSSAGGDVFNIKVGIKVGEVESSAYIHGVYGVEVKPYEKPEVTAADVMNNPILRKAMLKKPNLLGKILGKKAQGIIPGLERFDVPGKKGNKVKFQYLGEPFGKDKFKLRTDAEYVGRFRSKKVISIVARNRVDRFDIELLGQTDNEDEYKVLIRFKTVDSDGMSPQEFKYKTKIKILDYDY
jgi:hypothetical protein